MSEPADVAEARQKAEAAELAALEAERELAAHWRKEKGDDQWLAGLASLVVKANLLRSLAWRASLEYLAAVERGSEQAWAQAKQAPVTHGREAVFTQAERSPR